MGYTEATNEPEELTMATGADYPIAVVIVDRHEPEGETAGRLLELAEEKGYDVRTVEAQRGEHDAALSFRVPKDVAEAFNAERSERWPAEELVDDDGDPNTPPVRKARPGKAPRE
jgi:hypothetical protein